MAKVVIKVAVLTSDCITPLLPNTTTLGHPTTYLDWVVVVVVVLQEATKEGNDEHGKVKVVVH